MMVVIACVPGGAEQRPCIDGYGIAKRHGKPIANLSAKPCQCRLSSSRGAGGHCRLQLSFIAMLKLLFKSDRS
jgi:hypothetical protein